MSLKMHHLCATLTTLVGFIALSIGGWVEQNQGGSMIIPGIGAVMFIGGLFWFVVNRFRLWWQAN